MAKYKTNINKTKKAASSSGSGGNVMRVICQKRMAGKPCEYCDEVAKLYKEGTDESKELAGKTRAKSAFFMNVLPMSGENKGRNLIAEFGITIWRGMMNSLPDTEDDEDGVDFTDPDEAYPVIINRAGTGLNTDYTVTIGRKSIKVPEKMLKKMYDLSEIVEMIEADDYPKLPKLGEGDTKLIVLPPWGEDADGVFFKEVLFHWNIDLLNGDPDRTDGEDDMFADNTPEVGDGKKSKKDKKNKKDKKGKKGKKKKDDEDAFDDGDLGTGEDVPF